MLKHFSVIALLLVSFSGFSQEFSGKIIWKDSLKTEKSYSGKTIFVWPCSNCIFSDEQPGIPEMGIQVPVSSYGEMNCQIVSAEWKEFSSNTLPTNLPEIVDKGIRTQVSGSRGKYSAYISFPVVRLVSKGKYEVMTSYRVRTSFTPKSIVKNRGGWTTSSVLSKGDNYKVGIPEDGVYKLDYNYFKNTLGIDPASIDPRQIKIYGNKGGMLPTLNSVDRPDDLTENAIMFVGEEDGKFDAGDYVLFFAFGPNETSYVSSSKLMTQTINLYDTKNYYFIQNSGGNGKRIQKNNVNGNPNFWTNKYLDVKRLEDEKYNLLDTYEYASGSGRKWFGDAFGSGTEKKYDTYFSFPDIELSDTVNLYAEFAGRSFNPSRFTLNIAGKSVNSNELPYFDKNSSSESLFAFTGKAKYSFVPIQGQVPISIKYNALTNSSGWLDFIEVNAYRKLKYNNASFIFQDPHSLNYSDVGYQIDNVVADMLVWNISNPGNVAQEVLKTNGSVATFVRKPDTLERFICFSQNAVVISPVFVQKIENQNLHGIENSQLVILYDKSFEQQAMKLKAHRESHDGLVVNMVRVDQLYNEFSSGRQDITAIRDFARMVYNRTTDFKYLLLFGDGSFDYKNNLNNQPHLNFIPVFETLNSFDPVFSYTSDDYYGLLDPEEDQDLVGGLDIGIGRFPVNNAEEADNAVNKIIHYDLDPVCMNEWRNKIMFIADDEDHGQHLFDSDALAKTNESKYPIFNQDKVYLDAFPQVSTPGGDRIPEANIAINNNMYKGVLIFNYLGHGGPKGLAQERVVNIADINSWPNYNALSLLITATCTFTGYDDPSINTGGEQSFNSKIGGAIGLLTTTRAVYATSNADLVRTVYDSIFQKQNGNVIPIGEVCRKAKTKFGFSSNVANARKFTIIGDPTFQLALPKHIVETNTINGKPVDASFKDTLKALQKVIVEGSIKDYQNQLLSDFNGKLYITIFDKKKNYKTLGQDSDSPVYNFTLQKNIIFKGVTSVKNGKFSYSFIVPKDIDYNVGYGKFSYYAENGKDQDAAGYLNNILVGSTSSDAIGDNEPPKVSVYLNDDNFVKGGLTDANPILIAKISDDQGINITGNSIGHDLTVIIDENTQNQIVLNDYYESVLDNPAKGTVRYPLKNIAPGTHTLRVKAWDITNKSGEGVSEFVVAKDGIYTLDHVLNYPNPFTTNTSFQFEHNFGNKNLHVRINIYSISGSLVKSIHENLSGAGSRVTGIQWDGKDEYGNDLARGVYLYKVTVSELDGGVATKKIESDYEKLVILK